MKKINYLIILLFVSQLFVLTGCDGGFDETNTNPNDPSAVPSELLLAGIVRGTGNILHNNQVGGETGSCWVQHLGKPVYNDNELYIPRQSSIDALWSNLYAVVLKDADVMQNLAADEGNNNLQGIALVLKANAYQVLTDAFGNVPMSQALQGESGNVTPVYDDSETQIYPAILTMLDQAIALLDGTGDIDASQDLLYGGDWSLWKKYASSLKFKVLMRASSGGYNALPELQALVNAGNLFSSNADEAKLTYLAAAPNANPFFEGLIDGGREAEWCLGEELVKYMQTTSDPRLAVYAQEVGGDGSGNGYVGKPAGIEDIGNSFYGDSNNVSLIGSMYTEAEQPFYFLTYAQLSLYMAEAVANLGLSGDAATYFANGVAASAANNGVSAPSLTYTPDAAGLELIRKQMWVALYMQGIEAWAEWRRTGVPVLPLAQDAVESAIPTRFNYPLPQQSLNNANYSSAVSAQGADNLTTPLWWQE